MLYIFISLFNAEKVMDEILAYSSRAKMGLTKILYQLSKIKEFIENFNNPQNFSVHYNRSSIEITDEQVDEFISCNKMDKKDEVDFTSKSYNVSYHNPK